MKLKLFLLSVAFMGFFVYFSYAVAKERWQQADFDTTVKLQDRISPRVDSLTIPSFSTSTRTINPGRTRKIDEFFSYFSILGSVEITLGFCLIAAVWSLLRRKWLAILGWLTMIPALVIEIFGKLVVFHPGPPAFFHRSILPTGLPSFYVHTNFSYPSGHMMRTFFLVTVVACIIIFSTRNYFSKVTMICFLAGLALIMGLSRVYLGEHWLSDVLGGGLLGASAGFFASVLILNKKKV